MTHQILLILGKYVNPGSSPSFNVNQMAAEVSFVENAFWHAQFFFFFFLINNKIWYNKKF